MFKTPFKIIRVIFLFAFGAPAFCVAKTNRKDKNISELKQIANNRFKIDKNAQIEFFKNNTGQFPSIKIYLSDGNVFEEVKK